MPSPNADYRTPLVSVVISTYNRHAALYETLRALERQSLEADRYEVLVVDDGSSDGTWSRLSTWSFAYKLRSFRQAENSGISAARNVALREALGRYVVIMADDLVAPWEFLALHVEALERNPGCWVVGGFVQLPSLRNALRTIRRGTRGMVPHDMEAA
jgi:glycosyltransferase involved in cell wall biosynthesis